MGNRKRSILLLPDISLLVSLMIGQLYCLQARPIVTLPPSCFFDKSAIGTQAVLWDNSNIVESYSGVTSPLTFSFASRAYEQVREGGRKGEKRVSFFIIRYTH